MKKRKMQDIIETTTNHELIDPSNDSSCRPAKKLMIYLPKDEYIHLLIKSHHYNSIFNQNPIIKILQHPNHSCFPFFESFSKIHLEMLIARIFNNSSNLSSNDILTYRIPDLNYINVELIIALYEIKFIPDFRTLYKFINKYLLVKKQLTNDQVLVLLKCMTLSTRDGQLYEHQIRRMLQFNRIKFMTPNALPLSTELENEKKIFIEFLDLCACRISKNYKSLSYLLDLQRFPYLCFLQTDHWWHQQWPSRSLNITEKHKRTYHDALDEYFPKVLIPIVKSFLFF